MQNDSCSAQSPLQRYVGSWRGEVTVEAAGVEPQRYTQTNRFVWTLGDLFLEERGAGSNGSSFIGLWSLDAGSGKYRAFYFIAPSADVVALTHEWNEADQTFTGSAELGGGVLMLAKDRFIDRDTYDWSITIQDGAGNVLTRMRSRACRVKAVDSADKP